jgi:hypothetical protein
MNSSRTMIRPAAEKYFMLESSPGRYFFGTRIALSFSAIAGSIS